MLLLRQEGDVTRTPQPRTQPRNTNLIGSKGDSLGHVGVGQCEQLIACLCIPQLAGGRAGAGEMEQSKINKRRKDAYTLKSAEAVAA